MASAERCRRWALVLWVIAVLGAPSCHGAAKMDIHSMLIQTKVTSRFARTLITMEVQNPANVSQEAVFDVELPKTAFITNFSMTVDNVTNVGEVKEKAEAKQQYQKAVSKGQSAGLVQSTGRKMEHFRVSVSVGPNARATFKLTYEELLKRQLGIYELYLRVRPKELVQNFKITVDIVEPQGISFLKAVGTFISNALADIILINRTETKAHIEFKPTIDQQRSCPNCVESILDGDLMIKYDVKRESTAGKMQVINGYFVHYFAPPSLKRIPKNVVFVIDHSGSMYGNKIKQTYEAFIKILEDVPQEDYFGILIFDDRVDVWRNTLVKAVPERIKEAKEFVSRISARGGTDINQALLTAAKMLTNATFNNMLPKFSASIIIFLSDGEPTSGTTNHDRIIKNLKSSLEGRASLYCLGFGRDVDYNFLEKLALDNGGLARRIYEDSDSALQLQGFYNEVAYPMLLDVHLQYSQNSVEDLTQSSFRHYYQGSEIIVAGHISDHSLEVLSAEVTAQGVTESFSQKLEARFKEEEEEVEAEQRHIFGDFTERLWAYLTTEQLLTKLISLEGEEKRQVTEKALNLSLKYHFVTPLTSMVVTPPEKDKKIVAQKPKEDEQKEEFDFDDVTNFQGKSSQVADSHYYVDYAEADLEDAFGAGRAKQDAFLMMATHRTPVNQEDVVEFEEPDEDAFLIMATHRTPVNQEEVVEVEEPDACDPFHIFLEAGGTQKLCIQISAATDVYVNLFHDDESLGVTLNGKLADERSFERLGLVNKKLKLRVEVAADAVTVTRDADVKVYNWNATFSEGRFLVKDSDRIRVEVHSAIHFTIFRVGESLRLSGSVDDPQDAYRKVAGPFLAADTSETSVTSSSSSFCSYLIQPGERGSGGSCRLIRHQSPDSSKVPDLFSAPSKSS